MVNMVLVEGEVTYTLRVATLVDEETAQDEERVKELLEALGDEQWSSCADTEVEYDNEVPVLMDKETAEEYVEENVGNDTWKKIVQRSKELQNK